MDIDHDSEADWPAITAAIRALTAGETDTIALMATVVCELHHAHPLADRSESTRLNSSHVD